MIRSNDDNRKGARISPQHGSHRQPLQKIKNHAGDFFQIPSGGCEGVEAEMKITKYYAGK